jgi:hypothetical protein
MEAQFVASLGLPVESYLFMLLWSIFRPGVVCDSEWQEGPNKTIALQRAR